MVDKYDEKILTHEEHRRLIRKFWVIGCSVGITWIVGEVALVYGLYRLHLSPTTIAALTSVATTAVIVCFGAAFAVPSALTTMVSMILGIQLSRRALYLGQQTSSSIESMQGQLTPVIADLKVAITDITSLVKELKDSKDLEKINGLVDKLSKDGRFEKAADAISSIPKKLDEMIKGGVSSLIDKI